MNSGGFGSFSSPSGFQFNTSLFASASSTTPFSFASGGTTGAVVGQTQTGTGHVKFAARSAQDIIPNNGDTETIKTNHQCLTAMKEFENKSLEELRLEDYQANRKIQTQKGLDGSRLFSAFGTTQAEPAISTSLLKAFDKYMFESWLDTVPSLSHIKYSSAKCLLDCFMLALGLNKPQVTSMSRNLFDKPKHIVEINFFDVSAISSLHNSVAEAEQEASIEIFKKIYEKMNCQENDFLTLVRKIEELSAKKHDETVTDSSFTNNLTTVSEQFKNFDLLENLKDLQCPQCESTVKLEEWTLHAKKCLEEKKKCISCPVCHNILTSQSSRVFPCGHAICQLCLDNTDKSETTSNETNIEENLSLKCPVCRNETCYKNILILI